MSRLSVYHVRTITGVYGVAAASQTKAVRLVTEREVRDGFAATDSPTVDKVPGPLPPTWTPNNVIRYL